MWEPAPAGESGTPGPLSGVRIVDLSRILAGPSCTQLLGDLGADVIKIEATGRGDDTRGWGPPFLPDSTGGDSDRSAYFICANRNKRSVTLDLGDAGDRVVLEELIAGADLLVENFRPGGLEKFDLSWPQLSARHPGLIYCSISGFGQTGPRRTEAGYDFLAQAMGGLMSLTGAPEGEPMKVGVGITDLMCGMYAAVAILAALHERGRSGQGQHIDVSLFDVQLASLVNEANNFLLSGTDPVRRGNEHPNIVPYRAFRATDKHIVLTIGNDGQFAKWCEAAGMAELAADPRFATNAARVRNRDALHEVWAAASAAPRAAEWGAAWAARGVPCGPVNSVAEALDDPQARARGMLVTIPDPDGGTAGLTVLANPLQFSRTPVSYRRAPPKLGQHDAELRAKQGEPRRF
ncbi:MAG: CoA transferase [Pararhodobacter sp.]|nr:CoA transferase [Pararhodobacter sp.]